MRHDKRLIEAGFPCHQVGAETQRERGSSSALPPLYYLHVWWARRPLTPSRAAVLGSILPADADPDWFLRELGIERRVARLQGGEWVLVGKNLELIESLPGEESEFIRFDQRAERALQKENGRRARCREQIEMLKTDATLESDPVLLRWERETAPLEPPSPLENLEVLRVSADPAHVKERIAFAKLPEVSGIIGGQIKWDLEDLYGYARAFSDAPPTLVEGKRVLDMTAGGGSIPFEALRLGCDVIANELNPVASMILEATLKFPIKYGPRLVDDIEYWGEKLLEKVSYLTAGVTPFSPLPEEEVARLKEHCKKCPDAVEGFADVEFDQTGLIFARQVTCPHCGGEVPLLNTCWLSKVDGDEWGVAVIPDGKERGGSVSFRTYRVRKGRGPNGEDPNLFTVSRGAGTCVHCEPGIDGEEIKRQARGESEPGRWRDRLYAVAAVRLQPKLDRDGNVRRYKSGERKGEIVTEKVRFFRPPNERDLAALDDAEAMLAENWDRWEEMRLVPIEAITEGHKTREPIRYGTNRWCDMFTPRQLLGHLILVEELNRLKPLIIEELGVERGAAVVACLQFAIDKGLDWNSKQCTWIYQRAQIGHSFSEHGFPLRWTFAEMVFAGPNSGAAWGLSQILDAYRGIAKLLEPVREATRGEPPLTLLHGSAASMPSVGDRSVDVICFDPPYYDNVQYAELSDFFYVWQKRTLGDLFPELFARRLTDKASEAVANPARDGGESEAKAAYERMMGEIFAEARRVLKDDGIMTMMFTHKSQGAWESLTQALIENGWIITSTTPVASEFLNSRHIMENASAASSIFISCRKRPDGDERSPSFWTGLGGRGVQSKVRAAVEEGLRDFAGLGLNPVDEMVSCYGRALQVLSGRWPVLDGDEPVGPHRAMLEASRVVAEEQMRRVAGGSSLLSELAPEAAMAALLLALFGLNDFSYDEGLNLSRSLNISLENRSGGYLANGRFIGVNGVRSGRVAGALAEDEGFDAPLVRSGSKLRLAKPEERSARRMESPQTEWDLLHGLIRAFRGGGEVAARGFADRNSQEKRSSLLAMLRIWAAEVAEEELTREAETLLFALGERQGA